MMMRRAILRRGVLLMLLLFGALAALGCQGTPSEKPPIRVNPNMDETPRYNPQAEGPFFDDDKAMRPPVEGTVARGQLHADKVYWEGVGPDGEPVKENPVPLTKAGLERGRERFNIYCTPCHSQVGDGKGIVTQRGFVPPPSFHDDLIRNYPDGHIFQVISNGIRNMPAYGPQIPVSDRWLIVHYVRALQRSQNARLSDVPEELRDRLR
jgi:mono/diheme cytochrome c family protein